MVSLLSMPEAYPNPSNDIFDPFSAVSVSLHYACRKILKHAEQNLPVQQLNMDYMPGSNMTMISFQCCKQSKQRELNPLSSENPLQYIVLRANRPYDIDEI
jgi:hypothetical protein